MISRLIIPPCNKRKREGKSGGEGSLVQELSGGGGETKEGRKRGGRGERHRPGERFLAQD